MIMNTYSRVINKGDLNIVVVITGDASCGKSKILQRFVDEKFE